MNKYLIKTVMLAVLGFFSSQTLAADLLNVYQQALSSDPIFQQDRAQWLSDRENIAIARSAFLPSLDFSAALTRYRLKSTTVNFNKRYYNTNNSYQLTLSQEIFNYQTWAAFKNTSAAVKSSAANFTANAQNLIVRTAKAYFDVLEAQDVLRFTKAEKRALARQLEQDKQRYKVGLIAITGVYQTQAQYDATIAAEIRDTNDLANKKEALSEITGEQYKTFAKLGSNFPLLKPNPQNINKWVKAALKQNYALISARFALLAAKENVKEQNAQNYPSLNAVGSASYSKDRNASAVGFKTEAQTAALGLQLDFNILHGGLISAQTRQAEYLYQKAAGFLEQTKRATISKTRQDYLGVLSAISAIKADKRTIISDRASLKATEAEYVVGTSTMLDVLNAQSKLYNDQKILASDQYYYIEQTIALKEDAGILSISDIQKINNWLYHPRQYKVKKVKKPVVKVKKSITKSITKKKISRIPNINKQLHNINAKNYTIQLMAGRNKQAIINFINKNKISGKLYIYQTNGLYKLIKGVYTSKTLARKELHKINMGWIKSFAVVHREIDHKK